MLILVSDFPCRTGVIPCRGGNGKGNGKGSDERILEEETVFLFFLVGLRGPQKLVASPAAHSVQYPAQPANLEETRGKRKNVKSKRYIKKTKKNGKLKNRQGKIKQKSVFNETRRKREKRRKKTAVSPPPAISPANMWATVKSVCCSIRLSSSTSFGVVGLRGG